MNPIISVIIPTYHRTHSLKALLKLLKEQTIAAELEIIVVDQNDKGFLIGELGEEVLDGVIQVELEAPNVSTARNLGFKRSTADNILFIDDDLEPESTFCETGLEILSSNSEVGCLCPLVHNDLGKEYSLFLLKKKFTGRNLNDGSLRGITDTMSAAVFFKRHYFKQSGGLDELLFGYALTAEDQELFLRMGINGMSIWIDTSFQIYHNEKVEGGCELRTSPYWITREKCVKSWVLRYRIHSSNNGRLSISDLFRLIRSSFLNTKALRSGVKNVIREVGLLRYYIRETGDFLQPYLGRYEKVSEIDHLQIEK